MRKIFAIRPSGGTLFIAAMLAVMAYVTVAVAASYDDDDFGGAMFTKVDIDGTRTSALDSPSEDDDTPVARSTTFTLQPGEVAAGVPKVLSDSDVKTWKKLFKLERALDMKEVRATLPKLHDHGILMGHLISLRLLSPHTHSSYKELQTWLVRYHDTAPAKTIYRLAMRRRPHGKKPQAPSVARTMARQHGTVHHVSHDPHTHKRGHLLAVLRHRRIHKQFTSAYALMTQAKTRKTLGTDTYFNTGNLLAQAMLNAGEFAQAERMAAYLVKAAPSDQPQAAWIAAFAAYRQHHYEKAAEGFRHLAYGVPPRSQYYARAAWWAAEAYGKIGQDSMARVFLNMASQDRNSYYGQLASARLGTIPEMKWATPMLKPASMNVLMKDPGVRRTIALVQIGEYAMAQEELKASYDRIPYGMDSALLALSVRLSLPQASLTLARNLLDRGKVYMAGLYPTPAWQPEDGFHVDKGLLFALIRQESGFNPYAKSYVGARGLMQLMPGTAHHVRTMQGLSRLSRNELYNPRKNMKLGQDYLAYLQNEMDGNLVQMIAAYNAGPGNVHRWADNLPSDNPLLFIESIPYQETRNYVMHVMSNLWIYHRYFKGHDPILSAMAKNQWPSHVQVAQVLEHTGG